ncbi:ATP-binding cassette sub-family G member 1-like [Vespa mandarinia]|uniref:ATP-binding cassette sub-family G member 1-like n=1 Tax=Vespa mandarinia TaxID=7446 RepID=UPI001612F11D|nr:ATP-binding cassette sub-family G member 1-like [Vespa mandarinia]XP_035718101.1 ATP-binding cassette sub-family G member 1-like [Vespa mandarinia]XP_035718102.1 ATP-binding cassette sub-family G member 1-like [Vespa mandarinia]
MYSKLVRLNLTMHKSIDIEFSDVVYEKPNGFLGQKKQILKGINGYFKSGEMSAIIGPSGAGKSTLLNILTGFKQEKKLKGKINYLDKKGNKESWTKHRKYSCYILQEDYLPNLFTVNELMMISVNLKIGDNLNQKMKQILIDNILNTLDLLEDKNKRTDILSGGQKKRVSIALELVDNPSIMFLDEPTTGLDSYSSVQCIKMLKNLARDNKTIICTIHQPSATIYEMFDHIYLLADGRCMYDGTSKNTVDYFAKLGLHCPKYHNPADFIIEVVSNEYGNFNDQLVAIVENKKDISRENSMKKLSIIEENKEEKIVILINTPSEFKRLFILLNRSIILFHRDWTLFYFKMLVHVSLSILIGVFYINFGNDGNLILKNIKFLAGSIIYLSFFSVIPAVLKIPLELKILKKEEFNNWYNLRTYYLALVIVEISIQIFFTFSYCSISYFLSQPHKSFRFFMFFGINTLITIIGNSFGLIIGSLLTPVNGIFISSIILAIFILFQGSLILLNHIPKYFYYFTYFSYMKYAFEGLIQSIYGYNREKLDCPNNIYCPFRIPKIIIKELALTDEQYWLNLFVLIIFFIFYQILAYYMLKRKLSRT